MNFYLKLLRKLFLYFKSPGKGFRPCDSALSAQKTSDLIRSYIEGESPCMVGRFGSTELSCVNNYLSIISPKHSWLRYIKGEESDWVWNGHIMKQMTEWSGFFPSTKDSCERFSKKMINDVAMLDMLGKWTAGEENMIPFMHNNVVFTHLMFLEPFWCENPWTSALEDKKVLVVHPFADLIEKQYREHRTKLFENPSVLPEFKLQTIKAVQSLGGINSNGFHDWFEALKWMECEIDKCDYDVCLLGCGAYGLSLASHIKRSGKKAIHLGGALQLLFGIIGNRWLNPMYGVEEWGIDVGCYARLVNDYWVRPEAFHRPNNSKNVENGCYW